MQDEWAREIETFAQLSVVCRIKQVRACKKYLMLSKERSFAIFWKYICAMEIEVDENFNFNKSVPLQQCLVQEEKVLNHWIKIKQKLIGFFWHGYVLHEDITYKSRVPRTSQMTSRLLRHTAAATRAYNLLCDSYNTRPLLCARIMCYVTVIM
jgi:hypothetical protein